MTVPYGQDYLGTDAWLDPDNGVRSALWAPRPVAPAGGAEEARHGDGDGPAPGYVDRMVGGGSFVHDAPSQVPALWGAGDDVLWAEGEPLILTGPTGVGKTTVGGQVTAGRLGLLDEVLGYPVRPGRRVLYLAMDRPAQIARALRRLLGRYPREHLDDRLVVWKGPPPRDLARHPALLLQLAEDAAADTVVIDSLKDAAVKLTDEETGQGLSRAMNHCVAEGVEILAYHHQTKRGGGGLGRPNSLADVYGSSWITAGAGSVLLLWGAAGDLVVDLSHLKQPAAEVGPLQVVHDHKNGTSRVDSAVDVLELLRLRPRSVAEVAQVMFGDRYTPAQKQKALRKVAGLVDDGLAVQVSDEVRGGQRGGAEGARYGAVATHEPTLTPSSVNADARPHGRPTAPSASAGQATHGPTYATHAPSDVRSLPPLEGGRTCAGARCDRCRQPVQDSDLVAGRCRACAYPPGSDRPERNV